MMLDTFTAMPKSSWEGTVFGSQRPHIVSCLDRDKQDRHEVASGVRYNEESSRRYEGSLIDTKPLWGFHTVPDNEFEALMQCEPHADPKIDQDDAENVGVAIMAVLATLNPKERSVIELLVFAQMSLREAGEFLAREYNHPKPYSKALVAKHRDTALAKLKGRYNV